MQNANGMRLDHNDMILEREQTGIWMDATHPLQLAAAKV
jgi:hypothetical protein